MDENLKQSEQLEYAKTFGQPIDPRFPVPEFIGKIAEFDTADVGEDYYYFDVLEDDASLLTITSTGVVTQEQVSPDSPAQLTFMDLASKEFYVKLTDLTKAKESVIARKKKSITRAMDMLEVQKVVALMDGAIPSGNSHSLASGTTTFTYKNLVDMVENIGDYASEFKLIAGTTVYKDILLWNYDENKYFDLNAIFTKLGIEIVRLTGSVSLDGSTVNLITATNAYLAGSSTLAGKPFIFVRKKIDDIETLGGAILKEGDGRPQRAVFSTINPVPVGTSNARTLGVGFTGFEEIALGTVNAKATCKFSRS